ncbi:MAG: YfhO family protein [Clostridiales bacterium]|nr:YfhO family protein [Clostridiales bacterium]
MGSEASMRRRQQNLSWLLYLASAVFWVMNCSRTKRIAMVGYTFTSVIVFPGMLFLMGRESRGKNRQELVSSGIGMILLGFAQKVLLFWSETLAGRAPAFYPFSTTGAPWLFLVGGVCLILAGVIPQRDWMKKWLLPLTVAIGLAAGLVKPITNFLCLSRLAVYLPFFVLGRTMETGKLARWCRSKWSKLPSLLLVGGWAVVCVLLRGYWKSLRTLIDGNTWYDGVTGIPATWVGVLARLAFYVLAAGLICATWTLTPDWKVPLFTDQGKRWKSGYFWFSPLVYVLVLPMGGTIALKGAAVSLALCALVGLAAPSRLANWLPRLCLNMMDRLDGKRRPARALGQKRFWQRHRWGLEMTALFTVLFLVVAVAYVYPFTSNGISLVWSVDGLDQQIPGMLYFKEYVMSGLNSLLETGVLRFPQWDFTLGYGMSPLDVIRREPFMLLSLLGNEETMELIADITVMLRLYVCGLVFIWFCATLGKREKLPILAGALAYICSGYAIFVAARQPFFTTVLMTYGVMTLIGAERFIQQRKCGVFVLTVFLQCLSGYYSAYVNGVILAIYLLIRLFCLHGKKVWKVVSEILKLIGLYAWGLAMAACSFLPGILSFLGSARNGGGNEFSTYYTNGYYSGLLDGLNLEFSSVGSWTHISMASLAWLACILLFRRKRKELRPLKAGLIVCSVGICLPIFGLATNGFSYVCNRWGFAFCLLVAYILVEMLPDLATLTRRDRLVLTVSTVAYCAVCATQEDTTKLVVFGLLTMAVTMLVLILLDETELGQGQRIGVLTLVTIYTVMLNISSTLLPSGGDYVSQFLATGEVYDTMSGQMDEALSTETLSEDDSFYRVDQDSPEYNQASALDFYGTNTYYSIIPSGISEFFADVCLSSQSHTFCVRNLDERSALMDLASVKYYVTDKTTRIPYGFEAVESVEGEDGTVTVYENRNALPLGYTYTSYITQEEYEAMTPLERQQVMLESAVIGGDTDLLEHDEDTYTEERTEVKVKSSDGVTLDRETKTLTVEGDNSRIKLSFEGKANCETYLVIEGLEYASETSSATCEIYCKATGYSELATLRGRTQSYYFEKDAVVFHLGYSEESQSSCTLIFETSLNAVYDDIYVVCIPMDETDSQVDALREVTMENVVEDGDRITGTIATEESRLLTFSIPYAEGWSVYVNGQEAELLQVNVMYCGILLEPGEYEIELRYEHPGQSTGLLISAVAVIAILPVALVSGAVKRRRPPKPKNNPTGSGTP